MSLRSSRWLAICLLLLSGKMLSAGEHKGHTHGQGLQPIQLVQQLLNQGRLDEAEKLLSGLEGDESVLESFRGIFAMKRKAPSKAILHFKRVLQLKPNQTAVWLYLGQALFQLEQFESALDALQKGEGAGRNLPAYFLIRARAEQGLGRVEEAYGTLDEARTRFPSSSAMLREQALLLIGEGLYLAALEKGQEYLGKEPNDLDGYLILGEAMRKAGRPHEAAIILEGAVLQFGQEPDLLARLAFAYSSGGKAVISARLFERASSLGGDYFHAAAEQYRLAGRAAEALRMNALVSDEGKRLTQRLALLLGKGRFDRAVTLEGKLLAAGALNDTNRYRLAYALMRLGELDLAARLCRQIKDSDLIESANRLGDAISSLEKENAPG